MTALVRAGAIALALLLAAPAALAASWYKQGNCATGNPGTTSVIESGEVASWCPDGTASPVICTAVAAKCDYNDGGSGTSLSVVSSRSGSEWWPVPAATGCGPSNTTCSSFDLSPARCFTITAGNAGRVTCEGVKGGGQ